MRQCLMLSVVSLVLAMAGCDTSAGRQSSITAPSTPTQPTPPQPPSDTDPLTGAYALSLTMDELGSECDQVPDVVRHRTYSATINSTGGDNYVVSLSGSVFLSGLICTLAPAHLGCDQFPASRTGDTLYFNLINENDEGHGGHIVEQVPQAGWIEVIGRLTAASDGRKITGKGSGSLWYCSSSGGYPFPCRSYVGCAVNDMRMAFAPR
jgi:hypothetical protein